MANSPSFSLINKPISELTIILKIPFDFSFKELFKGYKIESVNYFSVLESSFSSYHNTIFQIRDIRSRVSICINGEEATFITGIINPSPVEIQSFRMGVYLNGDRIGGTGIDYFFSINFIWFT